MSITCSLLHPSNAGRHQASARMLTLCSRSWLQSSLSHCRLSPQLRSGRFTATHDGWTASRRLFRPATSYRRSMLCNFLGNHSCLQACTPGCAPTSSVWGLVWGRAGSPARCERPPRPHRHATPPSVLVGRHLVLGCLGLPTEPRPSVHPRTGPRGRAPFAFLAQRNRRRRPGLRPWPRGLAASGAPVR